MAIIKAKVDVTFAQRQRATTTASMVVFLSPGLEVFFMIECAIKRKVNGSRDVSATSIKVVPWMQTGLKRYNMTAQNAASL
jgi:hypothetical protein